MTPHATYRLQFRNGMTFERAAAEVVPYIAKLGVSHLYASPVFSAVGGSTHGYDVTDHNSFDPALGGRDGFERLSSTLKSAGLGLILDIVPNHMAASLENPWWRSVVEWGETSPYAGHFDIDWSERLTLPVLGATFDEVLAKGELPLRLDFEHGALALGYYDSLFPLDPRTYGEVLEAADAPLGVQIAAQATRATPASAAELHANLRRLAGEGENAGRLGIRLKELSQDHAFIARVHALQPWRLQFWKEARRHLSYRRFFEVTGLVGVKVEEAAVFSDVHRLVLELVRSGQVDGLRVDHVDGLADPKAYLTRLREAIGPDCYLVVEKVLGEHEKLPPDWPVEGTTGYEFAAAMPELFVEASGLDALKRRDAANAGREHDLEGERRAIKRLLVTENFETELKGLARMAARLAAALGEAGPAEILLGQAIVALIAGFPVYRSYGDRHGMNGHDRALLLAVDREAHASDPAARRLVLHLLLGEVPAAAESDAALFRVRFQQLTGPATAKSVEDTLFYRHNPLIALNEVGGDPGGPVGSPERFHHRMRERLADQPLGLSATATHDTKRGEDARARLYALSEAPELWADAVARWRVMNRQAVQQLDDGSAPEPEVEWLLYQSLAGVWPHDLDIFDRTALDALSERFLPYVEKALREAKRRTGWSEPNAAYEAAVTAYAARLLSPSNAAFLGDFAATLEPFIRAGRRNSLAQTLLKLAAPGIPDIYGGTEGWDFSLVDPDNRRSVDFPLLSRQLDEGLSSPEGEAGLSKQRLIALGLRLRKAHPDLFTRGSYAPLEITGTARNHVTGFVRQLDAIAVAAVVSRLTLGPDSGDGAIVHLPGRSGQDWEDLMTHRRFPAGPVSTASLLDVRPVALLRCGPADAP